MTVFEPGNLDNLSKWMVVTGLIRVPDWRVIYMYIDSEMILQMINKLRRKAAAGAEGIPVSVVKSCEVELCYLLVFGGVVLSIGGVSPIFEGVGKRDNVMNYRSMPVPLVWAKIFEKCLYLIIMT